MGLRKTCPIETVMVLLLVLQLNAERSVKSELTKATLYYEKISNIVKEKFWLIYSQEL